MLVVVKKPPIDFKIEGEIPADLLASLKSEYGKNVHIEDDDAVMEVHDMSWYREMKEEETPGRTLRFYRKLVGMTQVQLAEVMGISKQFVSNMENGSKAISRNMALKLGKLFKVPAGRFI